MHRREGRGERKTGAGGGRKNQLITVPPQGRMSLELKKCFLQEKVWGIKVSRFYSVPPATSSLPYLIPPQPAANPWNELLWAMQYIWQTPCILSLRVQIYTVLFSSLPPVLCVFCWPMAWQRYVTLHLPPSKVPFMSENFPWWLA